LRGGEADEAIQLLAVMLWIASPSARNDENEFVRSVEIQGKAAGISIVTLR
jgi:hypothetical protein